MVAQVRGVVGGTRRIMARRGNRGMCIGWVMVGVGIERVCENKWVRGDCLWVHFADGLNVSGLRTAARMLVVGWSLRVPSN